jgi:DNA polymerase-3 subunit alpha (Gram-positive type)
MEGYLVDDTLEEKPEPSKARSYHIILLAKNKTGLKNLYKIVTHSHLENFYRRPRTNRSFLNAHREGLILGSACEAGELMRAILKGADEEEIKKIASFYDYLEIQPTANNMFMVNRGDVPNEEKLRDFQPHWSSS